MRRIARGLTILLVLGLIVTAWFWWNRPLRVDMATYAPADAAVYLESNSLIEVIDALRDTDVGKQLGSYFGVRPPSWQERWLNRIARFTGIGAARNVMLVRAQVAVVALDLSAVGNEDTLEVKPKAALIIETHTSNFRVKPELERLIGDFARRAYGQLII